MGKVVLVDVLDSFVGTAEKMDTHKRGLLHRAFSLFIFDESLDKMLLQRRALHKYHSGGKWTNACCSHPKPNESIEQAVVERARQELGIEAKDYAQQPQEIFSFVYRSDYGELYEYEYDHVFLATAATGLTFQLDQDEVSELEWVDIDALAQSLTSNPDRFSTWFVISAPRVLSIVKRDKEQGLIESSAEGEK